VKCDAEPSNRVTSATNANKNRVGRDREINMSRLTPLDGRGDRSVQSLHIVNPTLVHPLHNIGANAE